MKTSVKYKKSFYLIVMSMLMGLILTAGCSTDSENNSNPIAVSTADLSGTIVNAVTNKPINDIWVQLFDTSVTDAALSQALYKAKTISNGFFTFLDIPCRNYLVRVDTYGTSYIPIYYDNSLSVSTSKSLTVTCGTNTTVNFRLSVGGSIGGTVTYDGNIPLSNFAVYASDAITGERIGNVGYSDLSGKYKIEGLPLGNYYRLRIEKYNMGPPLKILISSESGVSDADFIWNESVNTPYNVIGHVKPGPNNEPMNGLTIIACHLRKNTDNTFRIVEHDRAKINPETGEYSMILQPDTNYIFKVESMDLTYSNYATLYYDGQGYANEIYKLIDSFSVVARAETTGQEMGRFRGIDCMVPIEVTGGFSLAENGTISGKIVRQSDNQPVSDIVVYANLIDGQIQRTTTSNIDGTYKIKGLSEGKYHVYVNGTGTPYFSKVYALPSDTMTAVAVHMSESIEHIDFSLVTSAMIGGSVTSDSAAVSGLTVVAYDFLSNEEQSKTTVLKDGTYLVTGLQAGQYKVFVNTSGTHFFSKYFNDKYNKSEADPVTVTLGNITPNIDINLTEGGKISGKIVKNSDNTPIPNITIQAINYVNNTFGGTAVSNQNGEYTISGLTGTGLPGGPFTYRVEAINKNTEYVTCFFNNVEQSENATQVHVLIGQTKKDIDFKLISAGKISGKLFHAKTLLPIQGISVSAYSIENRTQKGNRSLSLADGSYLITGLPNGYYYIYANATDTEYLSSYYGNTDNIEMAYPVVAEREKSTKDTDILLNKGGKIKGITTREYDGFPIAGVVIQAYSYPDNQIIASSKTQADGSYTISGLKTDSYRVKADTTGSIYLSEYYKDKYSIDEAIPVSVENELTTTGINMTLSTGTAPFSKTYGKLTGTVTCKSSISIRYEIVQLPQGNYRVELLDSNDTVVMHTTLVPIISEQETSNIDFDMR